VNAGQAERRRDSLFSDKIMTTKVRTAIIIDIIEIK